MKHILKILAISLIIFFLIQCSIKAFCQSVNAGFGVSIPVEQTYGRLIVNDVIKPFGAYVSTYTDNVWKGTTDDTFTCQRAFTLGLTMRVYKRAILNAGIGWSKSATHIEGPDWDNYINGIAVESGFTWELINKNMFILGLNAGYLFIPSLDMIKVYSGLSVGVKIK